MDPAARKWRTQADNCRAVLNRVRAALAEGMPADRTLAAICRENRFYGSRDRQFFRKTVFAYFRWLGWLNASPFRDAPEPLRMLAALTADGCDGGVLPPAALVWAGGDDPEKWTAAAALPTPEERFAAVSGVVPPDAALIPAPAVKLLAEGAETGFLPFLKTRSPLWVRAVPGAESRVAEEWRNAGLTFEAHPRIINAFRFPNDSIRFDSFDGWKRGLFEMQDFSSQCIGLACCAEEGENWLDPCAGGGGKSLQLAAAVGKSGSVTVGDIRTYKLDVLERRAARTPFAGRFRRAADVPAGTLFDGVIADVPCSSSGRWRRNPDARWTGTEERISEITETQYNILEEYARFVKPGGKLVYGTCSVFAAENRLLAQRFLAEHGSEFEPVPWISPHTGALLPDGMLQTFPADAGCDGSFAALFRRK